MAEKIAKAVFFWSFRSFRLLITLLVFVIFFFTQLQKSVLSIAVVCMLNNTATSLLGSENASASPIGCRFDTEDIEYASSGSLVWSTKEQGLLFSAAFWGSFITAFPAGWMADRYGAKYMLLLSLLLSSISSLLTPVASVKGGIAVVFVVRFIMGIGHGFLYPAAMALITRWIPKNEQSTSMAIYTSGSQVASIVGLPFSAWLCTKKDILGGWPAIFYSSGSAIVFCFVWMLMASDKPENNRWASEAEKKHLNAELGEQASRKEATKQVPWFSLLTSPVVLACMMCDFSSGITSSTMSSYVPTYFRDVLGMNVKQNGLYAALPFLANWIARVLFASLSDALKRHTAIPHSSLAKVFTFICFIPPPLFFIGMTFLSCEYRLVAVAFMCIGYAGTGVINSAYFSSVVNIAPQYAGTIMSMCCGAYSIGALLAPYLVGILTTHGTAEEWRILFIISCAVSSTSGIAYLIFGTTNLQKWAVQLPTSSSEFSVLSENDKLTVNLKSEKI